MTYKKEENYCTLSPDELFGVRFNHGCYLHDRQYRNEVKKRKTRAQADKDLRDNIYKTYSKKNKKVTGYIVSRIYYYAVKVFAGSAWVK